MTQSELQSRVRRLELLLIACGALAVAPWIVMLILLANGTPLDLPIAISARRFNIVDAEGRAVITLANERGAGMVHVVSNDGRELATLGASTLGGSGSLSLRNTEGKVLIDLGDFQKLGGSLLARSPEGKQLAYLGPDREGGGNFSLCSKAGEPIVVARDDSGGKGGSICVQMDEHHASARLGPDREGNGQLRLLSNIDKDLLILGAGPNGHGQLEISTHEGKNYAYFLADKQGLGSFGMLTSRDKAALRLDADPHGGELHLFNSEGSEVLYGGWTNGGSAQLMIYDDRDKRVAAIGSCHGSLGGGVHAFGANGETVFYGGVNDRDGSGALSLFHVSGQQIFGAGLDGEALGGVINVRDNTGKMTLRVP